MEKQASIIYIGDFDLRNENAQAHLVKNNSKILNRLGYRVAFIGVNREASFDEIENLPKLDVGKGNMYLELQSTLSVRGLLKYRRTSQRIMSFMNKVAQDTDVQFVISYQSPTYATFLKKVALWCRKYGIKYVVNCADITSFKSQPLFRRIAMTINWHYLHNVNRKNADGIIAVSSYIEKFYYKKGRPTLILPPLFDEDINFNFILDETTTFVHAGFPFAPLRKRLTSNHMKDRLDLIVDWFIELSNKKVSYKLIIIGLSKELYCENIPWQKEQIENNSAIVFKGRCSHADTLSYVMNSDYMITCRDINPMTEAGFPTKVVESVSLGTPVIMNDVGDTLHYLKEGISGYKLGHNKEENVALLSGLCGKTMEERISAKLSCARLRTFNLDTYQTKIESFLSNVDRI